MNSREPNPATCRMQSRHSRPSLLAPGAVLTALVGLTLAAPVLADPSSSPVPASVRTSFAALPIAFEPASNPGGGSSNFLARGHSYELRIQPTQAEFKLYKSSGASPASAFDRAHAQDMKSVTTRAVRIGFVSGNPTAAVRGLNLLPGKINYLVGNDPARWRTQIGAYAEVQVEKLYPGIDLVYYGNQRQLEYDFKVAANTDPNQIAMRFEGVDRVTIDSDGGLVLGLGGDQIRQPKPIVYQTLAGIRRPIEAGFRLLDARTAGFSLGSYDHSLPLVIDPTLIYSTYFGGNWDDILWAVKLNTNDNSIYVAGQTLSSQFPGFEATNTDGSAFGLTNSGGGINGDGFVARIDSTGTNLLFLTFLGGTEDDGILDLALDPIGNAYLTGYTDSTNFPLAPIIGGVPVGIPGLPNSTNISGTITPAQVFFADAFVSELKADGSGLVFSTYLGGAERDSGIGIALDASNFVYVTGYTYSTNFPTTNALVVNLPGRPSPYQGNVLSGSNDVFVVKFTPQGKNLVYSTYLGGTNFDVGQGIAADAAGHAFVTGYSSSTNFPVNVVLPPLNGQLNDTTNAFLTWNGRVPPPFDAFVAEIDTGGANLIYSAYLGGTNNDSGFRIRLDSYGDAYVTGSSYSTDYPLVPFVTTNVVPLGLTNVLFINSDAFLTKIVSPKPGQAPWIQYSLLFGGPQDETGWDLAIDPATTNVFVVGTTTSTNFPAYPASATNAPFLQATNYSRSNDVFVAAFTPFPVVLTNVVVSYIITNYGYGNIVVPILTNQLSTNMMFTNLYAVALGGARDDFGYGIDVDSSDNVYIVGQTESADFPTAGALQPALAGRSDGFLAKIQFADSLAAITVDTVPSSLDVIIDGVVTTTPLVTNWVVGSLHSLWAVPVQSGGLGTQFVWTAWSYPGLLSNTVTPTGASATYTASFATQYFLSTTAEPGGGINPGSGWYNAGAVVPVTAVPAAGSSFLNWTFSGTGSFQTNPSTPASATATLTGPLALTANFTAPSGSILTVVTNGNGTVSPSYGGQSLVVGQTYTMTAIPAANYLFAGWTGDIPTNTATLTFVMTNALVLQANFVPNPFLAAQGSYAGLFLNPIDPQFQSSGSLNAQVNPSGTVSLSLQLAGRAYGLSGQFSTSGAFSNSIIRGGVLSTVSVLLQLDLTNNNRLTGLVSDGTFTGNLLANRAFFSNTNPAPQAGQRFIMRIAGGNDSLIFPGGDGYGTVSVNAQGNLNCNGALGDGTRFVASTFVSETGLWPFFASPYGGNGVILGWLSFSNNAINGPVFWSRLPRIGANPYPGGFSFSTVATGSTYAFTNGTRALDFANGVVKLENGGMAENLTAAVTVDANNRVTVSGPNTNRLNFSISAPSGVFQGSFVDPNTLQAHSFTGALLQNQTNGTGYFSTTNQTGRVFFGPIGTTPIGSERQKEETRAAR